jgi:hypothetical protein
MLIQTKIIKSLDYGFIMTNKLISHSYFYIIIRLEKVIKEKLIFIGLVYYY